jgi:hypothetical protein
MKFEMMKVEFKTFKFVLTDSLAGFVICVVFTVLRHNRENVKSVTSEPTHKKRKTMDYILYFYDMI